MLNGYFIKICTYDRLHEKVIIIDQKILVLNHNEIVEEENISLLPARF